MKVVNASAVKIMLVFLVELYAIMLSMKRNTPKVMAAICRVACAANSGVSSSTKNGPSAAAVVTRPIIGRRYALFCRMDGRDIHGSKIAANKNTNGTIIKVNDCLSVNMI